jgi:hypothetical protein
VTSIADLKPFCLIIASLSLGVRVTCSLASFSDPKPPIPLPPLPTPGDCAPLDDVAYFYELIYCMKWPPPPVGSVAFYAEYPAPYAELIYPDEDPPAFELFPSPAFYY